MVDSRDHLHVAKLALFNVRLLSDFEHARHSSTEVSRLVETRADTDRVATPVGLINQATFLGIAYTCLVWLHEHAKESGASDHATQVGRRFDFSALTPSGPRSVEAPSDFLRLIRNAISHGKIDIEADRYVFSDKASNEPSPTRVSLTWPQLGQLCEAALFAMNDRVYAGRAT